MSTLASQNGTKDFAFLSIIMGRIQKGRDLPSVKKFEKKTGSICVAISTPIYSRVHISSGAAFFKILKKPSIVQRKMILHMKANIFFIGKKQTEFFF